MTDTPLVAMTLAACGMLTLLILVRALRDVLARQEDREHEARGDRARGV